MNKTITKTRDKEKSKLLTNARLLVKKIEESNLIQGSIAKEINVSDSTLSRFMMLKPEYVTKRMIRLLTDFFDDRQTKSFE